jgi:hypothetical protein
MPVYQVFLTELNLIEPVLIAEIEAHDKESAIRDATIELGMHWDRSVNIETVMPEIEAKLAKVI